MDGAAANIAMDARASEVARELQVSRARVSQLTADGTLEGCFVGQGHGRRYSLTMVADRLNNTLDPGQALGNGAARAAAADALVGSVVPKDGAVPKPQPPAVDTDALRYQRARAISAEETAKDLQRKNALAEGTFLLAAEVESQVAQQIGQEIAKFEGVFADAARLVADELNVPKGEVLKLLRNAWRKHREGRMTAKADDAVDTSLSEAETEANF